MYSIVKSNTPLMSKAKEGENHPMFGRNHSVDTKTRMSVAK